MKTKAKLPVHRRVIDPAQLDEPARAALVHALYAIFAEHYDFGPAEAFEREVLFPPHHMMRLALLEDDAGHLVGFCNVYLKDVTLDGRGVTCMRGSVFARRGYDAAAHIVQVGMRVALWHLARRPGRRLWFFALAANAASYRMFPRAVPDVVPTPGAEDHPAIAQLAQLAAALGLDVDPEAPWRCRFSPQLKDPARVKASKRLAACPYARYYASEIGDRTDRVLLVLVPVSLRNFVGAAAKLLRAALTPRPRLSAARA